jgi:long-subunit fatty acid transport protein
MHLFGFPYWTKHLSILFTSLFFATLTFFGQNEEDVYRYSQMHYGGTARYHGVGGAFGAVGADFSVLSTNPAGMGRYRESDFSFTPTLNFSDNYTVFNGNDSWDKKENFNINNLGIVAVSKAHPESPSLWRAVQFGFGYNKLANFHNRYKIAGVSNNSFSQVLAVDGFYVDPDQLSFQRPFGASPAYNAWLIDPLDASGRTIYTTQMYPDSIYHIHQVTTKGSMGEWAFALSGNYNDKFYIGGTVGFQRINYEQVTDHYEESMVDTTSLRSFNYTETEKTTGKGINLKLGAIYLPTKFLRVGLAYHTSTNYYNMFNTYNTSIATNFRDVTFDREQYNYLAASPNGNFRYRMKTPSRVIASVAIVVKKKGLISLDYERVNYTNGLLKRHPLSGYSYSFEDENEGMRNSFRAANVIRIGGEYRLTPLFMLRSGVSYLENGYNRELITSTQPTITYSFGGGWRTQDFFLDVAYTLTKMSNDYYMYDPALVNNTLISRNISNVYVTIGFKF